MWVKVEDGQLINLLFAHRIFVQPDANGQWLVMVMVAPNEQYALITLDNQEAAERAKDTLFDNLHRDDKTFDMKKARVYKPTISYPTSVLPEA